MAAAASIQIGAGILSRTDSRLTKTAASAIAPVNAMIKAYWAVSDKMLLLGDRRAEAIADQPSRHTDAHITPAPRWREPGVRATAGDRSREKREARSAA
jgi:hypothetical protein